MPARRCVYLAVTAACLVFYVAYREWLSYFLLIFVLALPWFSMLCSLPAMISTEARVLCPRVLELGNNAKIELSAQTALPPAPVRCDLTLTHSFTGKSRRLRSAATVPAEHCGSLLLRVRKVWVYDYLGLFRFPLRRPPQQELLIRPIPQNVTLPDSSRCMANAWRPKPGGGFAENHELRLYRPGDNLHQIHWKLSAKTGKLILREPMERVQGLALLTMELRGTPEQLNQKMGQLLSASRQLASQEVPHQIHCLTAEGLQVLHVVKEKDVLPAIDALLRCRCAPEDASVQFRTAPWRFHIGGDAYES